VDGLQVNEESTAFLKVGAKKEPRQPENQEILDKVALLETRVVDLTALLSKQLGLETAPANGAPPPDGGVLKDDDDREDGDDGDDEKKDKNRDKNKEDAVMMNNMLRSEEGGRNDGVNDE
jgi:hypothetical protein